MLDSGLAAHRLQASYPFKIHDSRCYRLVGFEIFLGEFNGPAGCEFDHFTGNTGFEGGADNPVRSGVVGMLFELCTVTNEQCADVGDIGMAFSDQRAFDVAEGGYGDLLALGSALQDDAEGSFKVFAKAEVKIHFAIEHEGVAVHQGGNFAFLRSQILSGFKGKDSVFSGIV